MSKNLGELAGRKGVNQTLFEELGIAAKSMGTPSVEKMEELADAFVMGKANVFGAATFYDFLKPENKGKKVLYLQWKFLYDCRNTTGIERKTAAAV